MDRDKLVHLDSFEDKGRRHYRSKLDPADKPIRLLTYNVFMRPVVGDYTDRKDERLEHIIEAIMKYDIVCFQELFSTFNSRRDKLLSFASECNFKYASVPPCPTFFQSIFERTPINSGLLIISKMPIVASKFLPFKAKSGIDGIAIKGVLYSKISTGKDAFIHLFNTHLQATYHCDYQIDNASDHSNFEARMKQIEELRKAITECLAEHSSLVQDGPKSFKDIVLVAGDFNVNSRGNRIPKHKFFDFEWLQSEDMAEFLEYEFLVATLSNGGKDSVIDLAFNSYGFHPITYGDTLIAEGTQSKTAKDIHLTNKTENVSEQSLDYIFRIVPKDTIAEHSKCDLHEKTCRVAEFFVEEELFGQLSDHYGLECSLSIHK